MVKTKMAAFQKNKNFERSAAGGHGGRITVCRRQHLFMAFFNSAVDVLQTLVIALGAGLAIWGAINLLEGYGNDNPGANAHVP